jgi:hypothetical protein
VLFVEPGGELESLVLLVGTLDCTGEVATLLPDEGGEVVRIPEHLMDLIETVTDEHRECLEDLHKPYCLRAFYDGGLDEDHVDINAVLKECSGESRDNQPLQRNGAAGIVSFIRKLFGRGPGR